MRTLRMHSHFDAIPHALRVAYPRNARPFRSLPACSEGRVPSECASSLRISRALLGSRTLEMQVWFDAMSAANADSMMQVAYPRNAPRVAYTRNTFSLLVCSSRLEGCAPSDNILTLMISRMPRRLRTLEMHVQSEAFPHAPTAVAAEMHVRFDAVPHSPRGAYTRNANSL